MNNFQSLWALFLAKDKFGVQFNLSIDYMSNPLWYKLFENHNFNTSQATFETYKNVSVLSLYNLPRRCGKTSSLIQIANTCKEFGIIISPHHMMAQQIRTQLIDWESISMSVFLTYNIHYILHKRVSKYFLFDEFGLNRQPNSSVIDLVHSINPNQSTLIVFVE